MNNRPLVATSTTRRTFLAMVAASATVSAWPFRSAFGQAPAKYLRRNLTSPTFPPQVLASYAKAVTAMLQLPPTDPRNWYRNAFVHTLDCPHGNWWFLPWHRGYTGWFEEICRELSGDPNFALPFWDWTALPRLPQQFFDIDVFNPAKSSLYISSYNAFYSEFSNPMSAFWKSFSPAQLQQMSLRGYNSINDVWAQVQSNPMFFPPAQARALTPSQPNFDAVTQKAVSIQTIQAALAPRDFLSFGSKKATYHSQMIGFSILEGQPHNNVHNNVGGFMQDFLSPVDPIFFLHHANIDRLWDVWTRKQLQQHLPTLPAGADLPPWAREPFLFYRDAKGNPVLKNKAGDYATIDGFDYAYEKGSGESQVLVSSALLRTQPSQHFQGTVVNHLLSTNASALGQIAVSQGLIEAATAATQAPEIFASITLQSPPHTHGVRFNVFLNAPRDAKDLTPASPNYVTTIEFFGLHHHSEPATFTVPLSATLKTLAEQHSLTANEPLRIEVVEQGLPGVVPGLTALRAEAMSKNALVDVSIGSF